MHPLEGGVGLAGGEGGGREAWFEACVSQMQLISEMAASPRVRELAGLGSAGKMEAFEAIPTLLSAGKIPNTLHVPAHPSPLTFPHQAHDFLSCPERTPFSFPSLFFQPE